MKHSNQNSRFSAQTNLIKPPLQQRMHLLATEQPLPKNAQPSSTRLLSKLKHAARTSSLAQPKKPAFPKHASPRSEERRVGKEGGAGRGAEQWNRKGKRIEQEAAS